MNSSDKNDEMYVFEQSDVDLFVACDHDSIFSESEIRHGNSQQFSLQAKEAYENSNLKLSHIFRILACVCSPSLAPTNLNTPFVPEMQCFNPPRRSFLPEDLTDDEILLLEATVDKVKPPWLKSRIADILWLVVKGSNKITYAHTALKSYRMLPIDPDTWRMADSANCWERAYRLSLQIKHQESAEDIKNKLIDEVKKDSELMDSLSSILAIGPMETNELNEIGKLILERGKALSGFNEETKNQGFFARLWQKIFGKKKVSKREPRDFAQSVNLLEEAQRLFSKSSNVERQAETWFVKSWLHESDGNNRMEGELGLQLGALYSFQDALKSIRKIPIAHRETYQVPKRIRAIRKKIRKAGEHTQNNMPTMQVPTGITPELVREAETHVRGSDSVEEAVFRFSGLYAGPKRTDWMRMTNETNAEFPLSGLFGATHLAGGRVVGNQSSRGLGNEDTSEKRSDDDARFSFLRTCVPFVVRGQLQPGLTVLLSEHTVPLGMMVELARRSNLVAEGREYLVGLGLQKGFEFDFATSVHILAPQLENIVRSMVHDRGGVVSTIDQSSSVENYIALGSLLDKPEARDALGEDLEFEIRSIFTDKRGPNLRNDVAHGEMDDFSSQNEFSVYAWWMILRMLCHSIFHPNTAEAEDID